jgi:hypothetical protein
VLWEWRRADGFCASRPAAIVNCLFSSNSKVRFRAKIKIILKKLCRRFGYDRILELAPETDRKLITHIQKQAERGARIEAREKEAQPRGFEDMMGSDEGSDNGESDDDEADDMDDGLSRRARAARLGAEAEGEASEALATLHTNAVRPWRWLRADVGPVIGSGGRAEEEEAQAGRRAATPGPGHRRPSG